MRIIVIDVILYEITDTKPSAPIILLAQRLKNRTIVYTSFEDTV